MSWRDNLQDASFRGIPFKVEKSNTTIGRRIKEYERWQKRTITVDEGPILPKFSVTGYVIQNNENDMDYFSDRDDLIEALSNDYSKNNNGDKYNCGTLIHPFLGKLKVHPGGCSFEENFREAGICRFEMEFLLEEDELFPAGNRDAIQEIDAQAIISNGLSIDNILDAFDTASGFVENLGADLVAGMMKITRVINGVNNVIKSTITTALGVITNAMSTITAVLDSPCNLYNTMADATESFKHLVGMGGTVIQGGIIGGCSGQARGQQIVLNGISIYPDLGISVVTQMISAQDFDEADLGAGTDEQTNNRQVCVDMIKYQILSFACRVFARIEFASQQSLLSLLEKLTNAINDFQLRLGSHTTIDMNDMYTAIEKMKTLLYSLMMEKLTGLNKETNYTAPNNGISTLALSYDLFEDVDRCGEIFNMNMVEMRHPGFIKGNTTIRVLNA